MSTFLMLSTLGPDGAATLVNDPDRLKEVNSEVESMGAKILGQWALLGQYDFCTILEVPDEKQISKIAVQLASRGTLKTLTLTAIPIEEFLNTLKSE
jgi:uncharacterized protein with GYD domain